MCVEKKKTIARTIADYSIEFFVDIGANLAAKISSGKPPWPIRQLSLMVLASKC